MQRKNLQFKEGFTIALGNARAQGAQMTIAPGGKEGGPDNRHRGADQWLFVVEGTGEAVVAGRPEKLQPGALVLIEHGETHEIRNTGTAPLKTVNIYVPPAYTGQGEELPAGQS